MTTVASLEYNPIADMERQEIEGLTSFANMRKPSIPFKVNYDDILVHEFRTGMKTNPRDIFNDVLAFADHQIENEIADFAAKDSAKQLGLDLWQIKTGFITIDICLHCFTKYECGEDAHDDVAIHRVVVTMGAYFDIKNVYRPTHHATKMFEGLNQFYCNLHSIMSADNAVVHRFFRHQ
jgi:hypothetical protein